MSITLVFNIFMELILLATMATLFIIKHKSGKSLIKITNYEAVLFYALGIVLFAISLYVVFFKRNQDFIFVFTTIVIMGSYFISWSIAIRNSICEKGIIIFPFLLKWSDIERFAINGEKIYFKKKKGYDSIIVNNKNTKELKKVLSSKIRKEIL
ncbi:DUF5673 domain-containing protein [Clostridium thailandense]|uniref:DUF5673 domain-containing protein n=1 Tax=Clostridium thailandense TaxID=2794346 RepID=UPI003989DCA5